MTLTLIIEGRRLPNRGHDDLTRYAGTARQGEAFVIQGDAQLAALMEGAEFLPGITRSGVAPQRAPRQRLRLYRDTLQQLEEHGLLREEQVKAGREISAVYELLMCGGRAGVGGYSDVATLPGGETVPARYGAAVVERYLPWKAWARATWINRAKSRTAYDVAVLVCVDGLGKRQVADALRMDHRDALRHLQVSLWRYALIAGWAVESAPCPIEAA